MTDRYAVIGNPISHTKSPLIHAAFARQCGHDISYEALLAPLDGFRETVTAFRNAGGRGMNVTVPFKIEAMALSEKLTPRAQLAQAVNTLIFDETGITGDNTDGIGLVRDIQRLGFDFTSKRILILGAGGATRGVILPILEEKPANLTIANRTFAKAEALKSQFAAIATINATTYESLSGQQFDIVINATSTSLHGEHLPLPEQLFAPGALAYDMAYGKEETPFQIDAKKLGATQTADGLGMLVGQAAESFHLWRGVRPEIAPVFSMLRLKP